MSVAKAYAKALHEAAKDAQATSDTFIQLEAEMDQFGKTLAGSPQLKSALTAPITSSKEKSMIVEALAAKAGYSPLFRQFLTLLAKKSRLDVFEKIRDTFAIVRLEAEGGTLGKLETAEPIEPSDVESLSAAFSKKLGRKVSFKVTTDSSLLAGMKVTVNGVTYDGSLASQLRRLRDRFVYGDAAVN